MSELTEAQARDYVWIEGTKAKTRVPRQWAFDPAEREAILRKFCMGELVRVTELIANGSSEVPV